MAPGLDVSYLSLPAPDGGAQPRLVLHHRPAGPTRGLVVYVHPFADEMNKARRMAARQCRAMAGIGLAVVQIDLFGCGDSAGDFGDATWARWVDDVVDACQWLRQQHPDASLPLWLWGLRAGCLLAGEAGPRVGGDVRLLCWQPVGAGRQVLQQFLRLRVAGGITGSGPRESTEALRRQLQDGQALDVAGYRLAPGLANGMADASLATPARPMPAAFFELNAQGLAEPSPAFANITQAWRAAGHPVHAEVVPGPAFWQTTEIEDAPALIDATLSALRAQMAEPAAPAAQVPPVVA